MTTLRDHVELLRAWRHLSASAQQAVVDAALGIRSPASHVARDDAKRYLELCAARGINTASADPIRTLCDA